MENQTKTYKYERGKIYKVVDIGYNECYIGSTTQTLSDRMCGHRADYKKWKAGKVNMCSSYLLFEKYGVENCKIELIEIFSCSCRDELNKREGYWIQQETCINKCIAGRSKKEGRKAWYERNKEIVSQKNKLYAEQDVEKSKAIRKKSYHNYYEKNKHLLCEKGKVYREENWERIREHNQKYTQENKERINKLALDRYHMNKEKYKSYAREKIQCPECPKMICRDCLQKHIKKKHTHDIDE